MLYVFAADLSLAGNLLMRLAEGEDIADRDLAWLVGPHLTFVVSGVLLALMDWIAGRTKH